MTIEVEHIEVVVYVSSELDVEAFYKPVLTFLGFSLSHQRPGFSLWISDSRRIKLVLIDSAARIFGDRTRHLPHATRLRFRADYKEQIQQLFVLAEELGATVLIAPHQYERTGDQHGLVFQYQGGAMLELTWKGGLELGNPGGVQIYPTAARVAEQ